MRSETSAMSDLPSITPTPARPPAGLYGEVAPLRVNRGAPRSIDESRSFMEGTQIDVPAPMASRS